ncbi:inositol monophosphatase family protein [Paenibacillus endoradicis]|uniref:inositol monophosphatase family protein n=1 Tax=Paenibacillus endoradicis TaxID=2972487 RepID=UPI002158C143|nr:inositol monophosphatase [Paenibacillus endoradicis]MCR8656418.1 inositol monophosphatase [Paenibacillus endoradicis]
MDVQIINEARKLCESIIIQAGHLAKSKFDNYNSLEMKDEFGDVITEVDHLTEQLIVNAILTAFPDHQIHSEEIGDLGVPSEWLWLIDPLDGTNNFVIGLPVFSTSITLMYRFEPVLGVIYESMTERLFIAEKDSGATCNGLPMIVTNNTKLFKGNIGWIQGHKVQNEETAVRLRHYIDVKFKRMLRLWAPTLQWCMLAKGDLDGIVLYNSEGDDLYSGILMVKEAGGIVIDFEGNDFIGMNNEPYLIACHPDHKDDLLRVVNEGLR